MKVFVIGGFRRPLFVAGPSHVRQEKATSPHSGYFHVLASSPFMSTRQFAGYVHPDPPCEFAVVVHTIVRIRTRS